MALRPRTNIVNSIVVTPHVISFFLAKTEFCARQLQWTQQARISNYGNWCSGYAAHDSKGISNGAVALHDALKKIQQFRDLLDEVLRWAAYTSTCLSNGSDAVEVRTFASLLRFISWISLLGDPRLMF